MTAAPAYLDHAATTPVRRDAVDAFVRASAQVGNPSSSHGPGRAARRLVDEARESMAASLGAHPGEVILTGGGTEADNLAVKGLFWARRSADPRRTRVLVSAVEHHAVLDAVRWLAAHDGAHVVELPVDARGRLDLEALAADLDGHAGEVALISVMWANNEVGTIQPIGDVVAAARRHGIPVHSDAVQAVGHLPVNFGLSGLAALSLSGHKLGAPAGIGALVARRDLELTPVLHGGGQERGVRSGTVPAALAGALAAGLAAAAHARDEEMVRISALRDRLLAGIVSAVPGVTVHGAEPGPERLPGNLHLTVDGADAEVMLFLLDSVGIAASSGSACQAGVEQVSHVLRAMGVGDEQARGALRFSLGHSSTDAEVDAVLSAVPEVVERSRVARKAF